MSSIVSRNPFSVAGRNIVIVGGTAGIGLAVAAHLAEAGASVIITGRRSEGEQIANDIGATFVQMDISDNASTTVGFASIATNIDGIDCLILNAGIDRYHGEIDDVDVPVFEQVFNTNTIGLVRSMAAGVNQLSAGGSIVVTSSPAGSIAAPGMAAYSASKAALDMLVRTWALELGPKQIRVNAVLPGIVESEMASESTAALEAIRRMTANGMYRKAAEMGPVFQFLASDASAPLTGSLVGAHDGISVGYSKEVLDRVSADIEGDA
ncbi:MAG: SDR family oxidoreductase [Acidimicrobiales bacterium]|nr:SDR family oxidoreductase [Acidimicrobiales bacterium]